MHIYLGSDRTGIVLKKELKTFLDQKYQSDEDDLILDLGVFTNDDTQYLEIEREVCEKVLENEDALGVVFSANVAETCTFANKTKGIKAIHLNQGGTEEINKAVNVLCFPANFTDVNLIKKTVADFIDSKNIKK